MRSELYLPFNPKPPTLLHLDLNSCFASVEQQANPHLRGVPMAVAAYDSPGGCIVSPSREAKQLGVRVGMRVKEGRRLYPKLVIKTPDPWKYRSVHLQLKRLLTEYTNKVVPKSIDEFVLDLEGCTAFNHGVLAVGREIKERIRKEVGDWLTVSVGIGPNRFLAKTGAGLNKPDGLDIIDVTNYQEVYARLKLDDLCGIKLRNMIRLNNFGIYTVTEFANAPVYLLKAAFASIVGYYWHLRLRGWEIDQYENERKSFGHSYALQTPYTADEELAPLIMKLTTKMCQRLRKGGYYCHGIHFLVMFRDGTHWHRGHTIERDLFSTTEIYKELFRLFAQCPYRKPVRNLAVSVFNLVDARNIQLGLFENTLRNERLYTAIDAVNQKWGDFVITPARMMGMNSTIIDRVAFGGVKELEEMIVRN